MASPESLHHTFYENAIPSDIEQLLVELYQSPFCVTEYFRIFKKNANLNAVLISSAESAPRHLLAYVIEGKEITVLNELFNIEQIYVRYFSDTIFSKYQFVCTINLNCIKNMSFNSNYPWRLWNNSHDIVIDLPETFELYHSSLSKHSWKNLKYYMSRVRRDYADFDFQIASTHDIDPAVISKIIEMNLLRMKSKNIRSGFTSDIESKIMEFCRQYGSVCTVRLQGRTVAGAICYEIGNQAYLEILSHDPEFNDHRVGQICLLLTVKQMIENGRTAFHLLWGENEYKYRFLGVKQDLFSISIYRSKFFKLLSAPKLAKHYYDYSLRQMEYLVRKYVISNVRKWIISAPNHGA